MSNRGAYLSTTKEYRKLVSPGVLGRAFGSLGNALYARKKLAPINYKLSIGWKQHVMGLLRKQQEAQQKLNNLKKSWKRGMTPVNFKSKLNNAQRNVEEAKRQVKNARKQKVLTIGSTEYTKKGTTPVVSTAPVVNLNNNIQRLVNIARKNPPKLHEVLNDEFNRLFPGNPGNLKKLADIQGKKQVPWSVQRAAKRRVIKWKPKSALKKSGAIATAFAATNAKAKAKANEQAQSARILANQNAKQKAKAAANAKAANANASRKRSIAMIRGAQNAGYGNFAAAKAAGAGIRAERAKRAALPPLMINNPLFGMSNSKNNNGLNSHALNNSNNVYYNAANNSNNNFREPGNFPINANVAKAKAKANEQAQIARILANQNAKQKAKSVANAAKANSNAAKARSIAMIRGAQNAGYRNAYPIPLIENAANVANNAAASAAAVTRANLLAAPQPKRINLLREVVAPRSSGLLQVAGQPKRKTLRERAANLVRARNAKRNAKRREAALGTLPPIFPRYNLGGRAIV
jgi:hypothetical protein